MTDLRRNDRHKTQARPARGPVVSRAAAIIGERLREAMACHQQGDLVRAERLYRDIIARDPRHFDALHLLGVLRNGRGDPAAGIELMNRALRLDPGNPNALSNLGNALFKAGRLDEALACYDRALALQPVHPDAANNRGNTLRDLGRFDEALASFDKAIEQRPDFAAAHNNRGDTLREMGRLDEALSWHDRALAPRPDFVDALNSRSITLRAQGRLEEAAANCERALAIQPDHGPALANRGVVLHEQHQFEAALASHDLALARMPDDPEVLNNRGNTLLALDRSTEALALFDTVLALRPHHRKALLNRANALLELRRPLEALECLRAAEARTPDDPDVIGNIGTALGALERGEEALAYHDRALALRPDDPELMVNRASALRDLGRFEEALACLDTVLAARPDISQAHNNRGLTLRDMGRLSEVLDCYEKAIAVRPNYASAHWNEALHRLADGDFARGWEKVEWRWRMPPFSPRFGTRPWLGDAELAGKTILLHAEQGFGDTMQFCRYAPMVAALGARVVLEVQPRLVPLLRGLRGVHQLRGRGDTLPPFDFHCPLMSLPLAFRTTLATIPADIPYLSVTPDRLQAWEARLGPRSRPRVGLVFAGNKENMNDRYRSAALNDLLRLFDVPLEFVCLHKELRDEDRASLMARGVRCFTEEQADFADAGALTSLMDLVVSVDTAVAHLAGALGLPVWIMLPHLGPDWRWLRKRTDSPWYPKVRLFRQPERGGWAAVANQVAHALGDWVPGR